MSTSRSLVPAVLLGALLAPGPARAFEIGVGVGPAFDLPGGRGAEVAGVAEVPNSYATTPLPGGRVVAPMLFRFSEAAAFRLTPSVDMVPLRARVTWEVPEGCSETGGVACPASGDLSGQFGFAIVPKLAAGVYAEGPLGKGGARLTGGAGLSVAYVEWWQSIGELGSGREARAAYYERSAEHCNTVNTNPVDPDECGFDAAMSQVRPGVDLHLGVRLPSDRRPLFVDLAYSFSRIGGGTPKHYPERTDTADSWVYVPHLLLDPISITVGFVFGG